jgi:hypothetical protein
LIEIFGGPSGAFVTPKTLEVFLEKIGPNSLQVDGNQLF